MKALILAGGRGKRLGLLSKEKNKCMVEFMGKPLIAYSLDCARQNGMDEIVVVVGYKADDVINRFGSNYQGIPLKYVRQQEQKGLVHAIFCAKEAVGRSDFMLLLADELMINPKHSLMIEKFKKESLFGICGVLKVQDESLIQKTYGLREEDGKIIDLIEKPDMEQIKNSGLITRNIMGTGNCLFGAEIFDFIPKTPVNPNRGEQELPDLIKAAINGGKTIKSFIICDTYFNFNNPQELLAAESYFSHS